MMKATITLLVCSTLVVLTCANGDIPSWTGVVKTRNEQCLERKYNGACDIETGEGEMIYSCTNLRCGKGREVIYVAFNAGPVAEGTYCGESSACIRGHCVTLEAHQLPQYTGEETKIPTCN